MRVNSRKAGVGTVFWKHQLHETCGEQLTTAIVVVGAPNMRSGGTGEWILACRKRKQEGEEKKNIGRAESFQEEKDNREADHGQERNSRILFYNAFVTGGPGTHSFLF